MEYLRKWLTALAESQRTSRSEAGPDEIHVVGEMRGLVAGLVKRPMFSDEMRNALRSRCSCKATEMVRRWCDSLAQEGRGREGFGNIKCGHELSWVNRCTTDPG